MENAARGCVDVLRGLGIQGPICICCGSGNNGGDGLAMARRLDLLGYTVNVLLLADSTRLSGDAAINYRILSRTDVKIVQGLSISSECQTPLSNADWIVDALLGTGFRPPIRQPFIDAIQLINRMPARRLAVDLPSGLDCDTGIPETPTVQADHTCTFVATKIGFSNPAAKAWIGQVHIVDIGAPRKLLESMGIHCPNKNGVEPTSHVESSVT